MHISIEKTRNLKTRLEHFQAVGEDSSVAISPRILEDAAWLTALTRDMQSADDSQLNAYEHTLLVAIREEVGSIIQFAKMGFVPHIHTWISKAMDTIALIQELHWREQQER